MELSDNWRRACLIQLSDELSIAFILFPEQVELLLLVAKHQKVSEIHSDSCHIENDNNDDNNDNNKPKNLDQHSTVTASTCSKSCKQLLYYMLTTP